MQTIQIAIEDDLFTAADHVAQEHRVHLSTLVREALRDYLKRLHIRELEEQDRAGYSRVPDQPGELDAWERVASWPET